MRPSVLFLLSLSVSCGLALSGCSGSGSGSGGGQQQQSPNPVPSVAAVSPTSVTAGAAAQTITVTGTGFVASSVVSFNGAALTTTYASATSLQAQVPASALTAGEVAPVAVTNPSPGGGSSAAVNFSVMSPTPQVNVLSPTNVPQARAVTITITGTGFESNSTVNWNGVAKPTTFVNSTTLQVMLTSADLQNLGSAQVTVNNPGPGGSTTIPVAVVVYPSPTVTAVAPGSVQAGAGSTAVVVTGTNFVSGTVVQLDATAYPTTYTSATSLTAVLPASALANGRTASLTVQNPDPLPAVSLSFDFPVTSPTPVLNSIAPQALAQGQSGALITLTGTGFEANSAGQWNGAARTTTFVNPGTLKLALTAADLANAGTGQIAVNNPGPGGSTSAAQTLTIVAPPVISSVNPTSVPSSTSTTSTATVTITGTNFAPNATATLNGSHLTITSETSTQIVATLGYMQLSTTGAGKLYVGNPLPGGGSVLSQPATLNIVNPTGAFTVNPAAAAVGSADLKITLWGSGFFADSVVQWNGQPLTTTYTGTNSLTATIPAAMLTIPGTATISVATPENQGAAASTQGFSMYVVLPMNDLVWNSKDGLLYATVPGRAGGKVANSVVGIDPTTGTVQRTIFVGSEPNRLAISDDGTQAFVGLDGAGAVRQVDLSSGTAGVQWALGGTQGIYQPPFTATSLAVLPGQPNSVAVYASSGVVTIYDSGVARAKRSSGLQTYFYSNYGGLAFGSSASTLYLSDEAIGSYVYALTVDSTGVTSAKQLSTAGGGKTLQYDNGRLYFPNAIVADAATGNGLGQFSMTSSYSSTPTAAVGPVVSDSALNRAWVVPANYSGSNSQVIGYDETTFNPVSSVMVTGLGAVSTTSPSSTTPADLVRWGQNGLAFHTTDQLYLVHGTVVKDTGVPLADLAVTAQVPATVTTGTAFSFQLKVTNQGTDDGQGVLLTTRLPGALIYGSSSASQGSCSGNGVLYCDLGTIKNGASATVTVTATPSTAGTIQINAQTDAQSFDPNTANNQTTATTTASGSLYSPVPAVTSLSPNMVAAGASTFTLTVNGSGFTSASTVKWNGTALTTSLVNAGQVTATVDASLVQQLGWGEVSVSSAAPGGGDSGALTVSIYSLLKVPANAMTWDPFTRKLYAVLPSTSTAITGNSLVSVDPLSGATGQPIQVGSEPNLIAETTNGSYFYLGISGAKSLERFNVATQSVDATVPLSTTTYFGGPTAANGLAILPGLENSIAVDNIGIFDFNGTTATMRPSSSLGYNNAVFPDAGHAYTYDNGSTGAELYRYTVDSNGVHLIDGSTMLGMGGFSGGVTLDNGLIYGSGGGIIDPKATPPLQVGVLPLGPGLYGSSLYGGGVVPYAAEQKSFNVGINAAGVWAVFLQRFDTQHFALEETIQFPTNGGTIQNVGGTRWGQDGLAFILTGGAGSSSSTPQIFLLRGPFVVPAEAGSNAAPSLSAVGAGTVTVGSGNQRLSVTGSGFLPGASVVWNGVVHDTTFVDSQHLSVAVGASELSAAASVSVTCRNPGSGDSNAVTVNVQ